VKSGRQITKPLHLLAVGIDDALDLRRREDFFPLPGPPLPEKTLGALRTFAKPVFFFLLAQPFERRASDRVGISAVAFKPQWGPEGAIGFDWRPFAPMHVVGQFRYGSASRSKPLNFTAASGGGTVVTTTGSQSLREDHWLIDFGIGRDFRLGNTHAMWTLGIRVADLRAKLTSNGSFHATTFTATGGGASVLTVFTGAFSAVEKSTFVGAGPRFGVQGDIPLGGPWSIDWLAGAAVLFGERSLQITATAGGVPFASNASDSPAVFNVDAQAGLSYWFSPTMKVTASYRFDGYFKALKTLNANNASLTSNIDRFYNGPMLRLTTTF
jgi:hypothetical protein